MKRRCCINRTRGRHGIEGHNSGVIGRCCINRARSVDVYYAQRSLGQPPIKSNSRVTA
ncbi:MAG: hypothetical protein V3Q69_09260 [Burkholderia sp.]